MFDNYADILNKVRETKPLIHHITNYVTVNDCANITLAIGASPVMADAVDEAADIAAIANAVVLNMGTLNERTIPAMIAAGKAAHAKGIPIVFDPVGAGASKLRDDTAVGVINELTLSVIRGNVSEIRFIAGLDSTVKGVDASVRDIAGAAESAGVTAKELAKKLGCVVVISGAADFISDGDKIVTVNSGHPMMGKITGTGCMCSSLIGCFCGVFPDDPLKASVLAMLCMGAAGERAFEKAGSKGIYSFRNALLDVMSYMNDAILKTYARYDES